MYVPDPDKWYRFYKLQAEGKLEPNISVMRGGERTAMTSIDRTLELYDPSWKKGNAEEKSDTPKFNFVSEPQQVAEQVQALLKLQKKGIKGEVRGKNVTTSAKRKRDASTQRKPPSKKRKKKAPAKKPSKVVKSKKNKKIVKLDNLSKKKRSKK